jgi:hypothetical protein
MSIANAETIYFTATGEENGKPLIFRSIKSVPEGSKESDYPYLINVYWPYKAENEGGMPNADSNDAQIEFEDALERLDIAGISHLMLVVTGNGRKEWFWYVKDIDDWMNQFNASLAGKPVYPIQIENRHQPDWSQYHKFISGVTGF